MGAFTPIFNVGFLAWRKRWLPMASASFAALLWAPKGLAQVDAVEPGDGSIFRWAVAGVLAATVLGAGVWASRRRPTSSANGRPLAPGDVVGRYTIVTKIGEGGVGEVFRARAHDGPEVALKVLHSRFAMDPAAGAAFHDEAALGIQLESPTIVRTLDFGESSRGPFIALEFVDGTDVERLLSDRRTKGEPLSEAAAVHVGLSVARALRYAHDRTRQLIHRDLSPSNLLISRRGQVKLSDFGVATKSGDRHATADEGFRGKLGYMSPEQARGEALDGRSDLYAVGLLLFELLTLAPAQLRGTDAETLTRILERDVDRLDAHRADLSPQWQDLLDSLLVKAPGERLQSAHHLEERLEAIAEVLADDGQKDLAEAVAQLSGGQALRAV